MKALRATLSALFVFVLLQAACSRKPAGGNDAANSQTDGAAQRQQQDAPPQAPINGDARALFERGVEAYRHDRDREAVEVFRQAVELDPDFAEAHYRLGLALHAAGQPEEEAEKAYEEAVKAYEKMTKRDEKDAEAFYFLGLCYEKLGRYDDAVKALKVAVKNSAVENDDKYFELAFAQYKLAQYDESVRALNKALEINPDNFPAQELLEQAKSGVARVEEFRKRQEQLRKQPNTNSGNSNGNSNSGANTNSGARANRNAGVAPPT
jgi:tetratricopeptide (TPR) repeat protein